MAAAPLLRLAAAAVLLLAGPVAAAEGGGSGVTEPSFLDTPTYTLALVLTCFLVVSLAFEQVRRCWRAASPPCRPCGLC